MLELPLLVSWEILNTGEIKEKLLLLLRVALIRSREKIFPYLESSLQYVKSFIQEHPVLVLVVVTCLIVFAIIGYVSERKERGNSGKILEQKGKTKVDSKQLCQYCNGYGETTAPAKDDKTPVECPHCEGTGWTLEK